MPPRRAKYDPRAKSIERSRRACKPHVCRRCRADVIVGQSDDDFYWTATVDAEPVDAFDEGLARLADRMSYHLLPHGLAQKLEVRDLYAMARPAKGTVHVDHVCNPDEITTAPVPDEAAPLDPWTAM